MAKTLTEHLTGKKCKGFDARPHYFQDGDFVTYFVRDDLAYEERVDELLTVYYSIATKEMVGCKIKGVKRMLQELGNFGVVVNDGHIVLGMLFMAAALVNPDRRGDYEKYGSQLGQAPVSSEELKAALAA